MNVLEKIFFLDQNINFNKSLNPDVVDTTHVKSVFTLICTILRFMLFKL